MSVFTSGTQKMNTMDKESVRGKDVRTDGEKGNPYTPSASKTVKNNMKGSEFSSVLRDSELKSDTTHSGENDIKGRYEKPFTHSASKSCYKEPVKGSKEFNS